MDKKSPFPKMNFSKKKDVLQSSASFEAKTQDLQDKLNKTYKLSAIIGIAFGLLGVTSVIMMLPLKTIETEIFTVDNHTGYTEKVTSVKRDQLSSNEAIARHFISNYISLRGGYNFFSLQQDYDAVMTFSAENVANDYTALFNSPRAPKIVYNKADNVVRARILSIVLTGSSRKDDLDKQALVRYQKTIKSVASNQTSIEYWNARLTYRIQPQLDSNQATRDQNPLGFVVTSYVEDKEER